MISGEDFISKVKDLQNQKGCYTVKESQRTIDGKEYTVKEHVRCDGKPGDVTLISQVPVEEAVLDDVLSQAIERNGGYPMSQTSMGEESKLYKDIMEYSGGDVEIADKMKANVYSDEFKGWFGDWQDENAESSKVVDENGEPKLAFHGTADIIRTFDEDFAGMTTANNDHGAFFFTDNYDVAEDYSRQAFIRRYQDRTGEEIAEYFDDHPFTDEQLKALDEDSGAIYDIAEENLKVLPTYLDSTNPMELDYRGGTIDTQATMRQVGFVKDGSDPEFEFQEHYSYSEATIEEYREDITEYAVENGYTDSAEEMEDYEFQSASFDYLNEAYIYPDKPDDGLIISNVVDDIGDQSIFAMTEYIVIKPNQIKSIFNCCADFERDNNIYGTKIGRLREGTQFADLTLAQIMETNEGREWLKDVGYFD